jgi:hypothetical protein
LVSCAFDIDKKQADDSVSPRSMHLPLINPELARFRESR